MKNFFTIIILSLLCQGCIKNEPIGNKYATFIRISQLESTSIINSSARMEYKYGKFVPNVKLLGINDTAIHVIVYGSNGIYGDEAPFIIQYIIKDEKTGKLVNIYSCMLFTSPAVDTYTIYCGKQSIEQYDYIITAGANIVAKGNYPGD